MIRFADLTEDQKTKIRSLKDNGYSNIYAAKNTGTTVAVVSRFLKTDHINNKIFNVTRYAKENPTI